MLNVVEELTDFVDIISNLKYTTYKTSQKLEYINLPCSFDIETSSFEKNDDKVAIMYAFAVDINHNVYIGRTWEDFIEICRNIRNIFNLSPYRRLLMFVHNLSYEFQFISARLEWNKVFALDERKVVYAISHGIEFRCSYLLSGYSLENLTITRNLPIKKLKGDLDYKLIRHSKTKLQDKEKQYMINDVEIIVHYIESLTKTQIISNIPITKTQYVRRLTARNCSLPRYKKLMSILTIEPEEYPLLKSAFAGGFTHANMLNSNKIFENVSSYDFCSSYPSVMIAEEFPLSYGRTVLEPSDEDVEQYIKYYCCIMVVSYKNIRIKELIDEPLSAHKCKINGAKDIHNGRVVYADELKTIFTEQDFMTVRDFYDYDECKVELLIKYSKGHLPKDFIMTILNLYRDKTALKGIEGKEDEYLQSKEMLNSLYGMTVTDILRDDIIFDGEWHSEEKDLYKEIDKYNKDKYRFLFYPWGIWVTAYARRNLFSAIKELKSDYIYSDTDSVKFINKENHLEYFENYNKNVKQKLLETLRLYKIDESYIHPLNNKGQEKWLGVWEDEGTYTKFKTLGAKRYMTLKDGIIDITVSGLNKKVTVPYILDTLQIPYEKDESGKCKISVQTENKIFDFFDDGMYIPKGFTGKNIHTYIDEKRSGKIEDYLGNISNYMELSCVHLDESDYSLSIDDDLEFTLELLSGGIMN